MFNADKEIYIKITVIFSRKLSLLLFSLLATRTKSLFNNKLKTVFYRAQANLGKILCISNNTKKKR